VEKLGSGTPEEGESRKHDYLFDDAPVAPDPYWQKMVDETAEFADEVVASMAAEIDFPPLPENPDGSVNWDEVTGAKYLRPPYTGEEPPFPDVPPTPEA
jgi:hypothetical protein